MRRDSWNRFCGASPRLVRFGLALFVSLSAWALYTYGDNLPAETSPPTNAGTLTRFLADLSANHPLWYALMGLLTVGVLALVLSLLTERLMPLLGYRNNAPDKAR